MLIQNKHTVSLKLYHLEACAEYYLDSWLTQSMAILYCSQWAHPTMVPYHVFLILFNARLSREGFIACLYKV